jgi:hypothetical protein
MKKIITVSIILIATLFTGCESRYRYYCQDPNNWEDKNCQRPYCEADGICTDELLGKQSPPLEESTSQFENCNCNQGE